MADVERIATLEKRVETLEILLNDVMHQIDKPLNSKEDSQKVGKKIVRPSQPKPSSRRKQEASDLKETLPKGFENKAKAEVLLKLIAANPDSTRNELRDLSGNSKKLTKNILHSLVELGVIKLSSKVVEDDKKVAIYRKK